MDWRKRNGARPCKLDGGHGVRCTIGATETTLFYVPKPAYDLPLVCLLTASLLRALSRRPCFRKGLQQRINLTGHYILNHRSTSCLKPAVGVELKDWAVKLKATRQEDRKATFSFLVLHDEYLLRYISPVGSERDRELAAKTSTFNLHKGGRRSNSLYTKKIQQEIVSP